MHDRPLAIIIATFAEAKPFIEGLRMREVSRVPVPIFQSAEAFLAVSGIGKSRAAAAVRAIAEYAPRAVCNCGAAGALRPGFAIGEVYCIGSACEMGSSEGECRTYDLAILHSLPRASLVTLDRAALTDTERREAAAFGDLADMEGAAIIGTCRDAGIAAYCVKVVSDTDADTAAEVVRGINATRHALYCAVRDRISEMR